MVFQFKQFAVDQTGCAMKINTDGVLLGALANHINPKRILDIGTGTGVIALMLAQRYSSAVIDGVEIDKLAAATASQNFAASPFADRLNCSSQGFEKFFDQNHDIKYDLIASNPPFYINSLKSPADQRTVAKHADKEFFSKFIAGVSNHLTNVGLLWLVLPLATAEMLKEIALAQGLFLVARIDISSYLGSEPHRQIVAFSFSETYLNSGKLTIYHEPKSYTAEYSALLKDFFTIF
ncbi:tRNA1(Val) (adenine(37)-N6)-methyltransferase [Mucilaginibacter ginkgonis]|uniref:tRNA1(Val) (adenine(37)-N6)-methyltransferase n=1 Tax=Mucilaginibacter ginkgonis TaxID=2682091 RepID=A0A6I4HWF6_9SPHI|nr:methyltransferase [Mucilaginibacter ginkgonis]QQL51287.1 methyltransferase [Mucilaginibacter ginkgonis]